jgi:RNA polymerase sigma-70 factor (ECF subfamily)
MLRITHAQSHDSISTLKLEGKLLGPWVAELARLCDELQCAPGCPRLDLAAVTFVDRGGVMLLRDLIGRGATVTACSALVAELLHSAGPMTDALVPAAGSALAPPTKEDRKRPALNDVELLARVRAGDERACEALVRQHGGRMLAIARRYLRTEEDSADAVQDAFLSAFRSLARFQGNSAVGTWLHRIVVNVCLMRLRARSRSREVRIEDLLPTFDETGHHSHPVRAWKGEALARLTRAETRALVLACIERLPDSYREILLLRHIEELNTEETAHLLGIDPGAVKVRLHRARQALRTLLEPVGLGDETGVATA